MTKAYSYIRFSTSKQELGDSLRRQLESAQMYAAKHGLQLDEVSYRDLGVSAFKRKNIERGALAAFIEAVKSGKIEKGSYLLVEQFDRLSRADIDVAVKLLLDLVHAGIVLVTLDDEKVWDKTSVKDIGNLILSIVFMSRANNESVAKADRLSKMWAQKKKLAAETKKIVTRECPRWLRVNHEGTAFVVLEEKVKSIRKVFDMRIHGFGIVAITRKANLECWPAPSTSEGWHSSLVGRLLKNRALLGEYQPHICGEDGKRIPVGDTIISYYPAVIDEQIFLRAQAASDRKGAFPGKRDINYRNWLQGLLKCSCGQSFVRKNKTSAKQPGYARYYCADRNRGVSSCLSVSSQEIEAAILNTVSVLAPQFFHGTARTEQLKAKIDVLEVDASACRQQKERFVEAIGLSNDPIPALIQRLNEAQAKLSESEKAIAAARAQLADLSIDSEMVFENIVKAIKDAESIDARASLKEDLSRIIAKCVIYAEHDYVQVFFRGNENVPVNVPLNVKAKIPGLMQRPDKIRV